MYKFWKEAIGGALALQVLAASLFAAGTWVRIQPQGNPPPGRINNTAVYDLISDRLIIFGGFNSDVCCTPTNDLWVLTNASRHGGGRQWIKLVPAGTQPPPLAAASAVYDPLSNRMIVFGGQKAGQSSNDLWILTHANGLAGTPTWQQVLTNTSPAPRQNHQAVYDLTSNRMIVFGGLHNVANQPLSVLGDLWVLLNANGNGTPKWQQLTPTGTRPPARHGFAVAYNEILNRLTVFGGCIEPATFDCAASDTRLWALANANGKSPTGADANPVWSELSFPGDAPIAHSQYAVSAYDPLTNRLFLFGGRIGSNPPFGTFTDITWMLDSANGLGGTPRWTMLTPSQSPAPRGQSVPPNLFDPATGRVIVFGGPGLNDTWTLDTR